MSVLVIGHHYWGHAEDLAQAKKNFQNQGGALSRGYTIVTFPDGLTFKGVDQMGRVHWLGEGEPESTEVPPRKRKV